MENIVLIIVAIILAVLLAHAHYWLARCERLVKELVVANLKAASHIEFATGMIAGQHERIRTLQDEVDRLRSEGLRDSTNVIELPCRPRQS